MIAYFSSTRISVSLFSVHRRKRRKTKISESGTCSSVDYVSVKSRISSFVELVISDISSQCSLKWIVM